MTNIQNSFLKMLLAVKNTCNLYTKVWSPYFPFASAFGEMVDKTSLVEINRDVQLAGAKGAGADKKYLRLLLMEKLFFVICIIKSYAVAINNRLLLENINYSISELKKMKYVDLEGVSQNALTISKKNAAALLQYGLTDSIIDELAKAYVAFSGYESKPRT